MKVQKTGFIEKNILYIFLFALCCIIGMKNNLALVIGIAILVTAMALSSPEHRFCWSLFLIPNIRILDSLGTTSIVNFLMVLPLFFYVAARLPKKKLMGFPVICGLFLYAIEEIHLIANIGSSGPLIAWVLAFMLCCFVTLDEEISISKNDATYGLIAGIIFSAIVYLVNNPSFTSDIINNIFSGYRFTAYGDDPNYYSLYMCISLASLVVKDKITRFDYILIGALVCLCFMTASKMCLGLMIINLVYLIVFTSNTQKKMGRNFVILIVICCVAFLCRDYIELFMNNLLNRAGGNNITLNTLTTGRSNILSEYIYILFEDISVFMLGKGFDYHRHIAINSGKGAHNTYLDVILAWGLIGVIVFAVIMNLWLKKYKKKLNANRYTIMSKFPFFILLINFLDLSCFSAGMFFFVITFCIIQLEPQKDITCKKTELKI